jgi:hypothetical protein
MHFAQAVPTVPAQRTMRLAPVVAARDACPGRPPWTAIFTKGYAMVAGEFPELRRAYVKFPSPHLYEYPASVASVAVERDYRGERAVFTALIRDPAAMPLPDIAGTIGRAMSAPVDEVKEFRRVLRLSGLPRPLRRLLWWTGLNVGRQRANYFGTFAVSVFASLGAEALHPLSPWTTLLNYGVIGKDGVVNVRVTFDHRVMDGATVARALARLEQTLNGAVAAELRSLPPEAG